MIELHCHLDGSLSKEDISYLCLLNHKENINLDQIKLSADKYVRSLNDYLLCFDFPISVLQTAESITYATYSLYKRLAGQGILYAEVRFAPQQHTKNGLTQEQVILAAISGLEMAKRETQIAGQLILCAMRGKNTTPLNKETIDLAASFLGKGVCGVDLAGAEGLFPNENYVEEFKMARDLNLPITIHSGEAAGAKSVWSAIKMGATRIGHGIRSIEDPQLIEFLAAARIGLEVCPTSEVDTCSIASYSDCPIPQFLKKNLLFTLATDDMTVSNITLSEEYHKASQAFHMTEDQLKKLYLNAVEMAFLDTEKKAFLRDLVLKKLQNPADEF